MEQRRQMGLAATLSVVTGESIALGIFLTPAAMARSLGSPLLLAAVWCGMGLITLCGALCYSELAINYPLTGGEYVYLRQGYGTRLAFLYGWMSAAVMDPGLAAALAVGAAPYVLSLFGLPPRTQIVIPALILIGLALLNYVGTRLSRRVMTTANLLKIAVLVCLVLWAWISGHATTSNLLPLTTRRPGSEPLFAAIAGATVSAFFSFGGWWEAGKIAGEVRNPRRNMPLAFTCGVLLVTAVYLLVSASFLMVVPLEKIVSNTAFVAQFGEALFGTTGGKVLSACVLLSVLGGLMALTMAAPRVYYAMAKDGAFFAPFGKLHPRFGTPANAVLLQTVLALLVLTFGAFDRILSFIIFSAVCFLALSVTTLFRMPQPIRRWWFPTAPIVFLLGCTIIDLMILMHDPIPALIGLVIVLCGDPVRRFFFSSQASPPTHSPSRFHPERTTPMAHIKLPEGLPGIRGAMAFRPETARPLNDLVEILLHGPNSLTPGERELIATYVSSENDCYYCQTIHGAVAAASLNGDEALVKQVKHDFYNAAISEKLKALLVIAGKVQRGGKHVTTEDVAAARTQGATDIEIHDTVLIAAAFCMFNRYVDGLATIQPRDEAMYRERGKWIAREGYVNVSKEYLPAEAAR